MLCRTSQRLLDMSLRSNSVSNPSRSFDPIHRILELPFRSRLLAPTNATLGD